LLQANPQWNRGENEGNGSSLFLDKTGASDKNKIKDAQKVGTILTMRHLKWRLIS